MTLKKIQEMLENYYLGKYPVSDGILLKFSNNTYFVADWPDVKTLTFHIYPADKLPDPHLNDAIINFGTISPDIVCDYLDIPPGTSTEEKIKMEIAFIAESIIDYMNEENLTCEPVINLYDNNDELEESTNDDIADLPQTTAFNKLYEETIGEFRPYLNDYKFYVTTPVYQNGKKKCIIKFASDDLGECQANAGKDDFIVEFDELSPAIDPHNPDEWLEFTSIEYI